MKPKFKIAIPSYKRPETLNNKTLAFLRKHGINGDTATVFVSKDEGEMGKYNMLIRDFPIVFGGDTLNAQRKAITNYFAPGTPLLSIDDDITDVYEKISDKQYLPIVDFVGFCNQAFTLAGDRLWGIYPVLNALFMKHQVTYDLRYIIGCLWGCRVDRSAALQVQLEDKEDFERSILWYIKHGSVVRFNYVAPKTTYYTEPGGMQVTRTEKRVFESAKALCQRFPMHCEMNMKKKSGHAEVRLKEIK